jgi:D-aminopeptidase
MNAMPYFMKSCLTKVAVPKPPVREADVELTPKAEAKVANRLPKAEQLNKFEVDLEAHDGGNQPA